MPTQTYSRKKRPSAARADSPSSSEVDEAPPHARPRTQKEKQRAHAHEGDTSRGRDKGKGKKRAIEEEDSSEAASEEEQGGKKGKKSSLSDEETLQLTREMARFILFHNFQHKPIRRDEIVKAVLTDGRGKHFNDILPLSQKMLMKVVGLELVLMRAKDAGGGKNPPKTYILRSALPLPLLRHASTHIIPSLAQAIQSNANAFQPPGTASAARKEAVTRQYDEWCAEKSATLFDERTGEMEGYGLLGVVLALILVNGKVLGDDQLVSYLKRLHLAPSLPTPNSPLFAAAPPTLHALLLQWTRAGYLERGKNVGAQPTQTQAQPTQRRKAGRPTQGQTQAQREEEVAEGGDASVEWRWGARAEIELGEKAVARFVQAIYEAGPRQAGANQGDGTQGTGAEARGGRGRTGEKLMREIARAAGTKKLEDATGVDARG